MYDLVALGELLIDFAPVSDGRRGYPVLAAQPGGAPANFLTAMAKYGAETALISAVGDDAFGRLLCRTMEGCGVDISGVERISDAFTTLAFVTLDERGERSFSFARKPGADTRLRFTDSARQLLDRTKALHFGTLSLTDQPARFATREAVAYAKSKGLLLTCDPNLRLPLWPSEAEARQAMEWAVRQAHVVKLSGEEADFLWGCGPEEGAERLLDLGVRLAMVTLGPEGCLLQSRIARERLTPPPVRAADTTGAGDIFGGAAVWKLLALGKDPAELNSGELIRIGRFATAAATLSTRSAGGIPSVPEPEEVETCCARTDW